ncbi:MAG TPA: glycosyltransferase family 2 protein [Chroococcidiopsis sp.]
MPENPWSENKSYSNDYDLENELEPISSLTSDLLESEDINTHFYRGLAGRRRKAAVALSIIWSGTIALHLFSWGIWVVLGLATLMGVHALRIILARPRFVPEAIAIDEPAQLPFVSLLVAAKNEETVISSLVSTLCGLDYPAERYELWVIDDNSTDRTAEVLDQLTQTYRQLHVVHRAADAGGGKSGALNEVWSQAKGDIIGVFDADARVPSDLLRRVLPLFECDSVGAVQVQKAVLQAEDPTHPQRNNLWIRGQQAEMALDSYFQQQRIAIGGIGELRGNGQFVRRAALERCGGWNEETITDDLDLTFRLHLDRWDVDFMLFPAVKEEGVTRAIGLWHQRNRWAEGGYQRYLDYWQLIVRNRMGNRKAMDMALFCMTQYIMPTAAIPDLTMAIARHTAPMLAPLTAITVVFSLIGMFLGLRRIQDGPRYAPRPSRQRANHGPTILATLFHAVYGTIYMLHWLPVIASTTARISVRPKRLKWVKTIHHGTDEAWLNLGEQVGEQVGK